LQIAICGLRSAAGVGGVRLAEWRKAQSWTQEELADALGCSQPFVSLIERSANPQIPGREQMLNIYRLTRGEVTPNDFYDLPALDQLQLPIDAPSPAPLLEAAA
jgi:transcriptional regulator with XRE-family HTH domain